MNIVLNGKPQQVQPGLDLTGLIASLKLGKEAIAVAINGVVVPRAEHGSRPLSEGDSIEIIHAVAGG